MAYAYFCDQCLNGKHDCCEISKGSGFGYGRCICPHNESPLTAFQQDRKEKSEVALRSTPGSQRGSTADVRD